MSSLCIYYYQALHLHHTSTLIQHIYLYLVLLSVALFPLSRDESERHDTGDVHLGTEDLAVQTKLLYCALHVLETFLVVGAGTSNPDLDWKPS